MRGARWGEAGGRDKDGARLQPVIADGRREDHRVHARHEHVAAAALLQLRVHEVHPLHVRGGSEGGVRVCEPQLGGAGQRGGEAAGEGRGGAGEQHPRLGVRHGAGGWRPPLGGGSPIIVEANRLLADFGFRPIFLSFAGADAAL